MANFIKLDTQYLNDLETSNYFGGLNGETNEQIQATRFAWVSEMAKRGFGWGCVIQDEDGEFAAGFESAAQESIDTAGKLVFA